MHIVLRVQLLAMEEKPDKGPSDGSAQPISAEPTVVLVSDLIFTSRIIAEARACGGVITIVRQPRALAGKAGRALIVDLNLAGAIAAAADWRRATGKPVIGFVSHSDQPTIEQARAAGIDQVMARSRFMQILPELLRPQ